MENIAGQTHENDPAELIVVCSPSLPKMMGALHPAGALYEKPVNMDKALSCHNAFVQALIRHGIDVLDVRDVLGDIGDSVKLRCGLEDLAASALKYDWEDLDEDGLPILPKTPSTNHMYNKYLSDDYKREVLKVMSSEQLVDIVLTRPTITISPSRRDTGVSAKYEFQPLTNLVFTRDQQITTKKGIIMARLSSSQRQCEVEVMKFCFQKMGYSPIGQIPEGAHLEGGDFFPAGDDLCLIGTGMRSDFAAVEYLMTHNLLGTRRVAVVKDELDQSQDRMHLDCVFNIISSNCCILFQDAIGENASKKRVVDEYAQSLGGDYKKTRKDVEFSAYLRENGYTIIPVSAEAQLEYGCNALNLGNDVIISVHKETARAIVRAPNFTGDVKFVDFSQITHMYGAVHCASQVIRRKRMNSSVNAYVPQQRRGSQIYS